MFTRKVERKVTNTGDQCRHIYLSHIFYLRISAKLLQKDVEDKEERLDAFRPMNSDMTLWSDVSNFSLLRNSKGGGSGGDGWRLTHDPPSHHVQLEDFCEQIRNTTGTDASGRAHTRECSMPRTVRANIYHGTTPQPSQAAVQCSSPASPTRKDTSSLLAPTYRNTMTKAAKPAPVESGIRKKGCGSGLCWLTIRQPAVTGNIQNWPHVKSARWITSLNPSNSSMC